MSLIEKVLTNLFFIKEKKTPIRVLPNMRSSYYASKIQSLEKVIKSLLFLFLKQLTDSLDVEFLKL